MSESLKMSPYGNWKVQNSNGELMFRCHGRKAKWYLDRGLAVVISEGVIRLTFKTKGPGHIGDEFNLQERHNCCVVCGTEKGLNRHHVIPKWYRKHFPEELKAHSSHDVLIMCIKCHELYEKKYGDVMKQELAKEYGVPLEGYGMIIDERAMLARKAAGTLLRYGKQLPPKKLEEFRAVLREFYGRDISEEDIRNAANLRTIRRDDYVSHAESVIGMVTDVEAFIRRWRQHFLAMMKPAYLPAGWDVGRRARRKK